MSATELVSDVATIMPVMHVRAPATVLEDYCKEEEAFVLFPSTRSHYVHVNHHYQYSDIREMCAETALNEVCAYIAFCKEGNSAQWKYLSDEDKSMYVPTNFRMFLAKEVFANAFISVDNNLETLPSAEKERGKELVLTEKVEDVPLFCTVHFIAMGTPFLQSVLRVSTVALIRDACDVFCRQHCLPTTKSERRPAFFIGSLDLCLDVRWQDLEGQAAAFSSTALVEVVRAEHARAIDALNADGANQYEVINEVVCTNDSGFDSHVICKLAKGDVITVLAPIKVDQALRAKLTLVQTATSTAEVVGWVTLRGAKTVFCEPLLALYQTATAAALTADERLESAVVCKLAKHSLLRAVAKPASLVGGALRLRVSTEDHSGWITVRSAAGRELVERLDQVTELHASAKCHDAAYEKSEEESCGRGDSSSFYSGRMAPQSVQHTPKAGEAAKQRLTWNCPTPEKKSQSVPSTRRRGRPAGSSDASILQDIQFLQGPRSPVLLLSNGPFARCVRAILVELRGRDAEPLVLQPEALQCLQVAAESFMVSALESMGAVAAHAKRATVMKKDVDLLRGLKQIPRI